GEAMGRDVAGVIAAAIVACSLPACTEYRNDTVAIAAPAAGQAATVPGASAVRFAGVGVDKRQTRDLIGTKEGWKGATISASNDGVDVVRGAVESALKAEGFAAAEGGLTVTVELANFYNEFRPSGFTAETAAYVSFTLKVQNKAGLTLYRHVYEGFAREG